jgi:hypothetical protein
VLVLSALAALGPGTTPAEPAAADDPAAKLQVDLVEKGAFPLERHLESADLAAGKLSFRQVFEAGDLLFHTPYNGLDGVGSLQLGNGVTIHRFALTPPGGNLAGLNSQSCGVCHGHPYRASAGLSHTHVAFDGDLDGKGPWNVRSTISVFGDGILQLLAQEITEELQSARDAAAAEAKKSPGRAVERALSAKGVAYGAIVATADASGKVTLDVSRLAGVDPDLVVRPMGWKGGIPTVRLNSMAPAGAVMGMQPEELVWRIPGGAEKADLDGDGVERELSVGDVTAITLYTAAQETPQSLARLAELGHGAAPTREQTALIRRGEAAFTKIGCAGCHLPEMRLRNTVFEEPTARAGGAYYDKFLAERDPGYDPERPVRFDVLADAQEPRAEAHPEGGALIRLYGDLKRHRMGRHLAEPGGPTPALLPELAPLVHEGAVVLIPPDVFLTPELWGVGNTGPWLHDGRAGSLREAVLLHGEDQPPPAGDPGRSEAQESRDAFAALQADEQAAVVAFLRSLVTFAPEG